MEGALIYWEGLKYARLAEPRVRAVGEGWGALHPGLPHCAAPDWWCRLRSPEALECFRCSRSNDAHHAPPLLKGKSGRPVGLLNAACRPIAALLRTRSEEHFSLLCFFFSLQVLTISSSRSVDPASIFSSTSSPARASPVAVRVGALLTRPEYISVAALVGALLLQVRSKKEG
ncbi:hypothetical protein NDU88_006994 [Pleurodeles waltl]|uniref:Uncharacterized protein n=1 Tax=Pleurodeles waltl TaxID=8319 RepID=A0AAV7LQR5_PLEWA|nr:hypothetical protein NDU88_006994 [Pleurodeles waltl]